MTHSHKGAEIRESQPEQAQATQVRSKSACLQAPFFARGRACLSARRGWLAAAALVVLALLFMAGQRAEAQAGGPVFALPGSLKVADAPYIALFVEADGATSALLAANPRLAQETSALAARGASVTVWGMRQPAQGNNLPVVRVSRVIELPPAAPTLVLPTATATPQRTGEGAVSGLPPSLPTRISLPAVGQPIADMTVYAANIRAGPGDDFAPIATVGQGARCLVLGRAVAPGWYYLQCPGGTGWVRDALFVISGPLAALPLLAPITPTPDPMATPPPPRWQGAAYANRNLAGEAAVILGADEVNFNWGLGAPAESMPFDEFSLRLEGELPFASGVYSVALTYDDGARLFINNELVIDDWSEGAARTSTWRGPLAGAVPLRIEYFEAYGDALLRLIVTPIEAQAAPPAPIPTATRPAQPPVDGGWLATYYGSPTPGGIPALAQYEALDADFPLNREYSLESPAPGLLGPDNWSARWRGRFTFAAGDYQFTARGNEGVRVYIDGVRVINAWPNAADEVSNIVRDVQSGVHEIAVELYDAGGLAWVRAGWALLEPAE